MTKQEIRKELHELLSDIEIFNQIADELDSWNGFLGDNVIYPMEFLEDFYSGVKGGYFWNLMNRIYFGHDEYNDTDSFNPNRDYFYFNGYGNLVSCDYKDYHDFVDTDELIDEAVDNYSNITIQDTDVDEYIRMLADEEYEEGGDK